MGATVARCSSAHDKAALDAAMVTCVRGDGKVAPQPVLTGGSVSMGSGGRERAARPAYRQCETTLTVGAARGLQSD